MEELVRIENKQIVTDSRSVEVAEMKRRMGSTHFYTIPISRKEANDYVEKMHRHHGKTIGDKYRVAAAVDNKIVGVVQVGRPVSRYLDDGKTVEVLRLCTDGTPNTCSYLYGRAVKIAELLGYERVITYTLLSENGASLKASGFTFDGVTKGGSWSCKSRPRTDKAPTCPKKRWVRYVR